MRFVHLVVGVAVRDLGGDAEWATFGLGTPPRNQGSRGLPERSERCHRPGRRYGLADGAGDASGARIIPPRGFRVSQDGEALVPPRCLFLAHVRPECLKGHGRHEPRQIQHEAVAGRPLASRSAILERHLHRFGPGRRRMGGLQLSSERLLRERHSSPG